MEDNTVSADPSVGTTSIHEVDRPSVITASRLDAKAIFGKDAPIVLSAGSSPVVLMGNWMNYREEAEFDGPWIKIEQGGSYITSIGNTYWTTRPSPFALDGGVKGRLTSQGDLVTADFGHTLTPLSIIESHVLTVTTSPFVIDGSWDSTLVDEPVVLQIENGLVVDVKGGTAAAQIRQTFGEAAKRLRSKEQEAVWTIAEFGFGMNPNARLMGSVLEDEKRLGSAYFSIGDNTRLGGTAAVGIQISGVLASPSLWLDETALLEDGTFVAH